MTREHYAAPAPRVEEARVDDAIAVEPAVAPPAQFTGAATADACAPVEPATLYSSIKSALNDDDNNMGKGLRTKQVRGNTGAEFESYAAVIKGRVHKNFLQIILPCVYDERDFVAYGEVKYYVLVKEGLCYIYVAETDPSPLYAIELDDYFPVLEDHLHPEKGSVTVSPMPNTNLPRETMKTVLLKNKTDGKQAFQFTFDTEHDSQLAKAFFDLVANSKKSKASSGNGAVEEAFARNEKS